MFNDSVKVYLTIGIPTVTSTLSDMICGYGAADFGKVNKVAVALLEFEQTTADFMESMDFGNEFPKEVASCKKEIISANERAIGHLEKIQSQGVHFEEYITALKQEIDTLKKELSFL